MVPLAASAIPTRIRGAILLPVLFRDWIYCAGRAEIEESCPCSVNDWEPVPAEAQAWEYDHYCDFDVLDNPPTQEVFDKVYWGRQPLLVKNVTRGWPAFNRWQKRALWDKLVSSGQDSKNISYFNGKGAGAFEHLWFRNLSLKDYFCHKICEPIVGYDQEYVFDRDDWNFTYPWLSDDAWVHFTPMVAHYDAEWHERWSRYFLVSAFGSGINFHRHTDAYNGLVYGRKRWFIYNSTTWPPSKDTGSLEWFKTVYSPEWDAQLGSAGSSGTRLGSNGLIQCMQAEGDLIYLPRNYWHATVALGQGIGVSGQFVRKTNSILKGAFELQKESNYAEARKLYKKVWDHRWDVENEVAAEVLLNIGVMDFHMGHWKTCKKVAKKYLTLAKDQKRMDQAREMIRIAKEHLGEL